MSVKIVTGMWGTAWERYASKYAETFTKYVDEKIDCIVLTDKTLQEKFPRAKILDLNKIEEYVQWKKEEKEEPTTPPAAAPMKDFWKYDMAKWMPQSLAPIAAIQAFGKYWEEDTILVWTDADCEFIENVDESWFVSVIGDAEVCTLERHIKHNLHSEIGFFAVRLNPRTIDALKTYANLFLTRQLTNYPEWHSAYAWDIAMKQNRVSVKNLNTSHVRSYPFDSSVLAEKMIHKKGHRKPGGGI